MWFMAVRTAASSFTEAAMVAGSAAASVMICCAAALSCGEKTQGSLWCQPHPYLKAATLEHEGVPTPPKPQSSRAVVMWQGSISLQEMVGSVRAVGGACFSWGESRRARRSSQWEL